MDAILEKIASKREYSTDSFEVKEIIGEYAFVMKQLCQLKDDKGMMISLVKTCWRNMIAASYQS